MQHLTSDSNSFVVHHEFLAVKDDAPRVSLKGWSSDPSICVERKGTVQEAWAKNRIDVSCLPTVISEKEYQSRLRKRSLPVLNSYV